MPKQHTTVGYTNLNGKQASSPIIKKKQIELNLENENLVPDLLLDGHNYKETNRGKAKQRWMVLSLIIIGLLLVCGIYLQFKPVIGDDTTKECINKYKMSERKSISKLNKNVDIAFMIEATSSNLGNIKSLSNNLFPLVKEVKREFKNAVVRVAVVAYRDYSDEGKHFKVNDFTTDINHMQSFLSDIKPTKGKSGNEDVLGAIEEALDLDWKSSNKLLYQISLSPPRGFCNGDCPGDANDFVGPDVDSLFRKMRGECLKYNIIETNQNQDIMIKKFENVAQNIDGPDMFHVHNMKEKEINFSEITSSVVLSIKRKLESLNLYFNSTCYHQQMFNSPSSKVINQRDIDSYERCLHIVS